MFDMVMNTPLESAGKLGLSSQCVLLWKPSVFIVLPIIRNRRKTKTIPHTNLNTPFLRHSLTTILNTKVKNFHVGLFEHSHKKQHLEIRTVKLLFLLIYEIMLKSIATARSECTAKQENKASYNTYYIVPDLIDFFGDDWEEIKTQTEKRNINNCKKYCTD